MPIWVSESLRQTEFPSFKFLVPDVTISVKSIPYVLREDASIETLIVATFGAWIVFWFVDAVSRNGTAEQGGAEQAPGELFVTVFVLIYLCMAFGGHFTPEPTEDPRDRPKGYVPYDRSDDY